MSGGAVGQFAWRNGPFLDALQNGDWILLDELNLASQSVLEGLNAGLIDVVYNMLEVLKGVQAT